MVLAFVRACDGDPREWERRWRSVVAELSDSSFALVADDRAAPYLGLAPYDADRFFGRTKMTARFVEGHDEHPNERSR
ncbi:hypothetical protein GCM10022419_121840 [Nonomuraea rosea]|uniref:Uncharacterized protein n=1 Tax=Nonomuraea rosea TaxID=638574 RepID=A0ABP6ZS53_9ACTN